MKDDISPHKCITLACVYGQIEFVHQGKLAISAASLESKFVGQYARPQIVEYSRTTRRGVDDLDSVLSTAPEAYGRQGGRCMKLSSRANASVLAVASGALLAIPLRAYASPDQQQRLIETSALPAYATVRDGSIDRDAIPAYEAMWALFAAVAGMEDQEATRGRKLLRDDIGLTANSADALLGYMRAAVEDIRISALKTKERTCSQRSKLTNRAALTDRLVQTDKKIDRQREAQVNNMKKILVRDEEAKVVAWVDENLRTTMQITTFDYATYLDLEQVSPDMFLDRLCDPPSATQNR